MTLSSGTKLGRYEIRSKIGEGGMGEVYLAQDTSELERTVVIKVLASEVASDPKRMQRFVQEARTVSALNHPNILTIYEFGREGATRFIATEYVDGMTLREHLRTHRMKLHEVLDIAAQVAAALDAAHEAHIIHRDIKPENIMIRRDGVVKVLDFGLAKLGGPASAQIDTQAPTRFKSDPGTVVGTANYMSPEQVRALDVDPRADIWSLGVVLYELVAGRLPFAGATTGDVIAAIIEREPPALARFAPVPHQLERIVTKALAKNRDERYQTVKDLLIDLKALRRELELAAELDRTVAPELRDVPGPAIRGSHTSDPTVRVSAAPTSDAAAHTTSSAEYIVAGIRQHKLVGIIAAFVMVVGVVALVAYLHARNTEAGIDSIAVLPFTNAGNDPNTEYLSDGITESIISNLSQLPQLKVMARGTVFQFKGKEIDPQKVGHVLNVRAVLTGRLLKQGDSLVIRAELTNTADGVELWGAEYDRKLSDALQVQQDISREISEKLQLRLTGEDKKRLTGRDTTNAEAYQFYLRGRYYWNQRTVDGIKKALAEFQQAIDRDPNYALGYVGLADCYLVLDNYAAIPTSEVLPKAKAAADRALQIDDSLAEAHTSLAFIYVGMWRWTEAEAEFKRAISLNQNYPTAHHWFSIYYRSKGQFDDAMREIKRAQELDPLSPVISSNVAQIYILKKDFNSATEECKRTIELNPSFPLAHETLGWAYLKERRYQEAIAEFQKALELSKASEHLSYLGFSYAVTGRGADALVILKELKERYAKGEANEQFIAGVYVSLGDKDQAFAWLEKDFEQRSGQLPWITWWFSLDDLRSDPRYADLVRRMGLHP